MLFSILLSTLLSLNQMSQMDGLVSITESENASEASKRQQIAVYLEQHRDSDSLTFLYHEAARWAHNEQDYRTAINWEREAVRYAESIRDTVALGKALYNLSIFYTKVNDFYGTDKAIKRIISIEKDSKLAGKAYRNLGTSHVHRGEYFQAEKYFQESEKILSVEPNSQRDLLKCYLQYLDLLLERQDDVADAKIPVLFHQYDSLRLYEDSETSKMRCLYQARKGKYFDELMMPDSAIASGRSEIALALSEGDLGFISNAYNNQGIRYRKSSDYKNSVATLLKASQLTKDPQYVGASLNNLGDTHLAMGQLEKALVYYQQSIDAYLGQFPNRLEDAQLDRNRYKAELIKAFTSRAVFYQRRFQTTGDQRFLQLALEDIHIADKVLGKLRTQSFEETSKLYWREEAHDVYNKGIEAAYDLGDLESYFYFMEKNKAILLLEGLTESEAIEIGGIPDSVLTKGLLLKALSESGDDQSLEDYVAYSNFQDQLKREYPLYTALKEALPVLTLDEIRTQLPLERGQAILQYFVGEEDVYGLYIDAENAQMFKAGTVNEIKDLVKTLKSSYQRRIGSTAQMTAYREKAYALYGKLLPSDMSAISKLLIVEDGFLQGLSFEALVMDPQATDPLKSYLIGQFEVSYAYSLSHLIRNNAVERQRNGQLLGIAPQEFPNSDLQGLPNSAKEVSEIQSVFDIKMLMEQEASKRNFLTYFPNFDVIHLSTHANSGDENNSWIRFYEQELSSREIYRSSCDASLIVLSACRTAAGEVRAGEGVMSLPGRFFRPEQAVYYQHSGM